MRILVSAVVILVVLAGGLLAFALRHPAIAPVAPPAAASFDSALVEKGEALSALGDCAVCHTRPGGDAYAGGLALETPFGVIHSTNITPDPETGIGTWSEEAFRRALHEGVDRRGTYLYPAFPYDHFTRVSDDDVAALYAYFMTRKPVAAPALANGLAFPFNQRILMAGWNLLFLDAGRFAPDPSKDAAWNRGAYLVEGLGHCGACHTPRNAFGAEDGARRYGGGSVEGWHAPALNAASPAPAAWTADGLVNYLLDGWDGDHGIAAGPMTPVVDELSAHLSEEDAYAIAAYILSFQDEAGAEERTRAAVAFAAARDFGSPETPAAGPDPAGKDPAFARGLATFGRVCANCHRTGAEPAPLGLTSTVNGPDPANFLRIVDKGIAPPRNAFDRTMPAFSALTDADLADLATFVRGHFSQRPAWPDLPAKVREVRGGG